MGFPETTWILRFQLSRDKTHRPYSQAVVDHAGQDLQPFWLARRASADLEVHRSRSQLQELCRTDRVVVSRSECLLDTLKSMRVAFLYSSPCDYNLSGC